MGSWAKLGFKLGCKFGSIFAFRLESNFGYCFGSFCLPPPGLQFWVRFSLFFSFVFHTIFGTILGPRGDLFRRQLKIGVIFSSMFAAIFRSFWKPLRSSFWCLFPSFSGSSSGRHLQGALEGPGCLFSMNLSMKTKVPLLSPWLPPDVLFGVKMGLQMECKMLPTLVQKISSKIVPFWLPLGSCHGAQKGSKIVLENHGNFDGFLDPKSLPQSLEI